MCLIGWVCESKCIMWKNEADMILIHGDLCVVMPFVRNGDYMANEPYCEFELTMSSMA